MFTKILRAIIIGAPGSGKGTISERIVKNFGFVHIACGDILRQNVQSQTQLGKRAKAFIDVGELVPDDIVMKTMLARITELGNRSYILDGFPRNKAQADELAKRENIDAVINLDIPHDVIIDRVRNRLVHIGSGRVYNIGFKDPKVPGLDDITGEPLVQREDDKPEIVKQRLQIFDTIMTPVIEYYTERGLVTTFRGTETNKIWPEVEQFLIGNVKVHSRY